MGQIMSKVSTVKVKEKTKVVRKQTNMYLDVEIMKRVKRIIECMPDAVPGTRPTEGSIIEAVLKGETSLDELEKLAKI